MQGRDLTYITAHFIDHEIGHLARMIRSRHWHRSKTWTVSYWRARIEELGSAPVVSATQRAELDALLAELSQVAAALDKPLNNSLNFRDVALKGDFSLGRP
jgi:hypothetical protein